MKIFLVLHNIRSVFNVGSIFRTADAFGVEKIYLSGYTPDPAQKTALGAEKYIEWAKEKNTQKLIRTLKKENFFVISLENRVKDAVKLNAPTVVGTLKKKFTKSTRFKNHIALILGNEVKGVPKSIRVTSDAVYEIPMRGKKESLNVSVAAGIALYAIIHPAK